MKFITKILFYIVFLTAINYSLGAAELSGVVQEASGKSATVRVQGELVPAVGDRAEIFFKLSGTDDEISVATGKVMKVAADAIELKIENATGEVAKDQLVRFKSENPQKVTAGASSSPIPESTDSIVGAWMADNPAGGKLRFDFRTDATFSWTFEVEKKPLAIHGKYRVDDSAKPARIDLYETDNPLAKEIPGLFQLLGSSQLKLQLFPGSPTNRAKGFDHEALVFSRLP